MTTYERVKNLLKSKGLTFYKLSKATNISEVTFSHWKNNNTAPKAETMKKIADYFDVSLDYLLYGNEKEKEKFTIPILGIVPCGTPIEAIEDIIEYIDVVPSMGKEHFGLIAKGDSMFPYIQDGDILIVKSTPSVQSGKIAITKVNGDEATCKKILISENGLTLVPLNPAYNPISYTPEQIENTPVITIGEVVEIRRRF